MLFKEKTVYNSLFTMNRKKSKENASLNLIFGCGYLTNLFVFCNFQKVKI